MSKHQSKSKAAVANQAPPPQEAKEDQSLATSSTHNWPFDNGAFAPFHSLRREVDDIFNQFTSRFGLSPRQSEDVLHMPALDLDETENSFEVLAELPGVAEEDIDISVTDSVLTIHGEKQHSVEKKDADRRISECSYGVFERSLSLPFNCDASTIEAQYDNGVLHLSIPKPKNAASQTQKVAIKTAA